MDASNKPRGIRFSIGVLVQSPDDVDALVERVRTAGGRIKGRSAYFADPEGNYWEVAWAPPDNKVVAAAARAAGRATPGVTS